MPRGIPNARRDDTSMRYTTFHVPLQPNPKHIGSSYLKSESQTLWSRNATHDRTKPGASTEPRGTSVLVIHPGSRVLRVGRAAQVAPVCVATVIARKHRGSSETLRAPTFSESIVRPRRTRGYINRPSVAKAPDADEYHVAAINDDPFEEKLASIQASLRDRMRFYKLRVSSNAAHFASQFNDKFEPEVIPQGSDADHIPFIEDENPSDDVLVGNKALHLSAPEKQGYTVRWPILGRRFNIRDYALTASLQLLMSDVQTILEHTLRQEQIGVETRAYKDYSVVLVVPDFYERNYVREWVQLLLVVMGFKHVAVLQESLAATYGAGISSACVVDIGATTTSISCVDDGLVLHDTRMSLMMGGDDVTEFLYVLLDRISFPYREADLARSFDWEVIEDLKKRVCTLSEADVALNLYDFTVRRPGKPTEKYGLRAYDEVILAPMCIFEPRLVDFDRKRIGLRPSVHPDVYEDIIEQGSDHPTQAMMISTQHLAALMLAQPPPAPAPPAPTLPVAPANGISAQASTSTSTEPTPSPSGATTPAVEGEPALPYPAPAAFAIDVCFEASKLPLDVAIFNSARAAGGDDKIRKYLQAVLVVGGGACVPGTAHALESRLQAIATPLVPNMEKVTIIPPPKGVNPQDLSWKGAAVLGKMEGLADLWVTKDDWDVLGMRGLKERCFYL